MKARNLIITISSIIIIAIIATVGVLFLHHSNSDSTTPQPTDQPALIPGNQPPYNFDYSWADSHPYIAHAFGGILGDTYTNSYEAFLLNYQLGHRIFEVDFLLTEDNKMYAVHDINQWREEANLPEDTTFSSDNVASALIDGKYHAVDITQLIHFMHEYPDIYVVTDTKHTEPDLIASEFRQIITAANAIDPTALDRFIIQIYYPDMLAQVMTFYPWKSVIYTLYADPNWTADNVIEFAQASGIKIITIWEGHAKAEILQQWTDSGLQIAIHTLNDLAAVNHFRDLGASVFYTDFLIPSPLQ